MFTQLADSSKAVLFYTLAFTLTFAVSLLSPLLGDMTVLLHMFTPALAVLLMLLVITRDGYTRAGWAALGLGRSGRRWWWLALTAPLVLVGAVYAIVWSAGVARPFMPDGYTPSGLLVEAGVSLVVASVMALGEELGFRAYLLPRVAQLGTGRALLLTGLLHGLWHFPLMLLTPVYPIHGSWLVVGPIILLTLTLAGVFYGYLRLVSTSVWPSTLAHGAINTALDIFTTVTLAASPIALEYLAGETGVLTLIGTALLAGVILRQLRRHGVRHAQRPEPAVASAV